MSTLEDIPQPDNGFYVLVTGANSGLGLAVGCRLIDEFLQTRPQSESLVLIITTRDQRKSDATTDQLQDHLAKACRKAEKSVPGISMLLQRRVHFRSEILDLLSLASVQRLSQRLRKTTPKLDAVIFNAGIGGWTDLNWGKAVWTILTDWKNAVTWPTYKLSGRGWVTKPQIPAAKDGNKVEEPPLGEVFCANFFGHYFLGHYLAPLLARHHPDEETRGRIIWVSSLEGSSHSLDTKDLQGIDSEHPYEASKRLTDLIAITSTLPSTQPLVDQYLDHAAPADTTTKPRMYVSHPGICGTSIFPLNIILEYLMFVAFYVARFLGSQWHPITVEKGAVSMVWLALAKQSTLDRMEEDEGVGKWGSATDWWGQERVERTEMDGWGWGGKIGERPRKGRNPHAKDLSEADRKTFEDQGQQCWKGAEALRLEWEKRLADAGVGVELD
ncbi:3-keto-steroid reductase [Corynespora cassiicola Philippines]|uniref:3-keto-steroid reductase n=1 Tax=Corynespora cassiicola Philippines TaxID=1448308 RepID=A0A2T2N6H0_CORCC|nr:3-keto-steroid reductase [Corynespora cassiicola Philippines]